MTAWVAPAAWPFTVLHTVEPFALDDDNPVTACCGEVMDPADLWRPVDRRPGDRVCPGAVTQEGIF